MTCRVLEVKFLELLEQKGKEGLVRLYLMKRRQSGLKLTRGGTMQFLSEQLLILHPEKNISWTMVPVMNFLIVVVLSTAKNGFEVGSFNSLHWLQENDKMFEIPNSLAFPTALSTKRKVSVDDIWKTCVVILFPAHKSENCILPALHIWLRAAFSGKRKNEGNLAALNLEQKAKWENQTHCKWNDALPKIDFSKRESKKIIYFAKY